MRRSSCSAACAAANKSAICESQSRFLVIERSQRQAYGMGTFARRVRAGAVGQRTQADDDGKTKRRGWRAR